MNEHASWETQLYAYQNVIRHNLDQVNRLMERNEELARQNELLRREVADLLDSNEQLTAASSAHAATLRQSWQRGQLLIENNIVTPTQLTELENTNE